MEIPPFLLDSFSLLSDSGGVSEVYVREVNEVQLAKEIVLGPRAKTQEAVLRARPARGGQSLMADKGIVQIKEIIDSLPPERQEIFRRIFSIHVTSGSIVPPATMYSWIERQFGSLDNVATQRIVKIINLVTLEGALFNEMRASRPIQGNCNPDNGVDGNGANPSEDPLGRPFTTTPRDTFGRVRGKHCITASNIAKYDGMHGIVSFKDYNPLNFTREKVVDYIDVGWRWAKRAHKADPSAKYFLFIWNSHWKAGASLQHGHAQVMMSQNMHYAKVESLRRSAVLYRENYDSDYFNDLYLAHESVGCGMEKDGVRIIASLTPVKDKEIMLFAEGMNGNSSFKDRIYEVLDCLRGRMSVAAFNLAIIAPPLGRVEEDWGSFPIIARVVDRGNPQNLSSDIGSMELYASNVIASDPMKVSRILRDSLVSRAGAVPMLAPVSL